MPKLNKDSFLDCKPLKLVKHVAIAHSGIYKYRRSELCTLGLDSDTIPEEYKDFDSFNVYRPAVLFLGTADLFTNLPLTVEHPEYLVDQYNCRDLMRGFTGNTSEVIMEEDGEAHVHSTLTLIDKEAVDYYDRGYREVSPGYISTCIWEAGEHNGEPYQIKMVSIKEVNHLALTRCGRGGKASCVRDSIRPLSILEWAKITMDSVNVKDMINKVAEDSSFISPIIESLSDIPDTNSKALFTACLDDMKNANTMEPAVIQKATEKLLQLYDKLVEENCAVYNIGGTMENEKPTEDFAPGATGVAGTGTQADENKSPTPEEKASEPKDSAVEKPAEKPATDNSSGETEHWAKEEKFFAELLTEIKAVRSLLENKNTSDTCAAEKPAEDSEKPEDKKVTTDSALVNDSSSNGMSIEDFMSEMRR